MIGENFRPQLIEAAKKAGLSAREVLRVRIRTLAPSVLEQCHDLCICEGRASGAIPMESADNPVGVDWAALADFLVKIMPLILQVLALFGL